VQIVQSVAARCQGTKQVVTAENIKDELAQHPASAALQSVEQLLEWRKLTPVYRSILEGEENTVSDKSRAAKSRR